MSEAISKNLIETCAQCQNTMDTSRLRPYTKVKCPHCTHEMRARRQLGNFEILARLGSGGMSEVYRALDTILKREVALKILNDRYASNPVRIANFEKEAKIMAQVSHENIVKVFTVGSDHGCVFIAMELVEGIDLETYLAEHGAQSESVMLEMAIQAVQGLKVASDAGLVHRDIKPANLIFEPKTRVVKVLDFGLADFQSDTNTTAEIWATPFYVSPETLKREPEDFRSDMFALGVTLMQLLTAAPPFSAEPRSIDDLILVKKEFKGVRSLRPKTSAGVADVLDTMMAFSPQDRYWSYDELLVDLFALQNQSKRAGSEVKSVETLAQRRRDDRRMKMTLIAVGVGLVASLVFGVSMLMGGNGQELVAPIEAPQRNASDGVDKSKQVQDLFAELEHACLQGDVGKAGDVLRSLLLADLPLLTHVPCAMQQAICAGLLNRPDELKTILESCVSYIQGQNAAIGAMSETDRKSLREMEEVLKFGSGRIGVAIPDGLSPINRVLAEMLDLVRHWQNGYVRESVPLASAMSVRWSSDALTLSEKKMLIIWRPVLMRMLAQIEKIKEVQDMPETTATEIEAKRTRVSSFSKNSSFSSMASFMYWESELQALGVELEERKRRELAAIAQREREEVTRAQKEKKEEEEVKERLEQEIKRGRLVLEVEHSAVVSSVAFSPCGKHVLSGSVDGAVRVTEVESGKVVRKVQHDGWVTSVQYSPCGGYVLSLVGGKKAQVTELKTGKIISEVMHKELSPFFQEEATYSYVERATFSQNGKYILSGGSHSARVTETKTGKVLCELELGRISCHVAFSPDGRYVLSGSRDGTVRVTKVTGGKRTYDSNHGSYVMNDELVLRVKNGKEVSSVAFSPCGKYVLSGSQDGTARMTEVVSGKVVCAVKHDSAVTYVSYSPDGRYVLSRCGDGTVRVTEVATGRVVSEVEPGSSSCDVAFSPNGRYVLSGSRDGMVRVTEVESGKVVSEVKHGWPVTSVAYSPCGKYILSGSFDNTARVTDISAAIEKAEKEKK